MNQTPHGPEDDEPREPRLQVFEDLIGAILKQMLYVIKEPFRRLFGRRGDKP